MKKKYLNKDTVTYRFKHEILTQDGNNQLGDDGKEMLWQLYLYQLSLAKFITSHSAKTWVYPKKALKND